MINRHAIKRMRLYNKLLKIQRALEADTSLKDIFEHVFSEELENLSKENEESLRQSTNQLNQMKLELENEQSSNVLLREEIKRLKHQMSEMININNLNLQMVSKNAVLYEALKDVPSQHMSQIRPSDNAIVSYNSKVTNAMVRYSFDLVSFHFHFTETLKYDTFSFNYLDENQKMKTAVLLKSSDSEYNAYFLDGYEPNKKYKVYFEKLDSMRWGNAAEAKCDVIIFEERVQSS